MTKYRKKPVEIEAFRFYVDPMPDWFMDKVSDNEVILRCCDYNRYDIEEAHCEIKTLEGVMVGNGGDYIIKGVQGELYPCKAEIFWATYDKVWWTLRENEGVEIWKNKDGDLRSLENAVFVKRKSKDSIPFTAT